MTDEQIKRVKELYHPGITVQLISMHREPQMPAGIKGRVVYVDDAGQIGVEWDNGSTLSLIPEADKFIAFDGPGAGEYLRVKLCLGDDAKIWFRKDPGNHTVNAAEAVNAERLIREAERYIEKNLGITRELALSTLIPYKTESLLDAFISAHILTGGEAKNLKLKAEFSKDESTESRCPKCGSDNINYGAQEFEEPYVSHPWTCPDCHSEGKEYGEIVFDGHCVENSPFFKDSPERDDNNSPSAD